MKRIKLPDDEIGNVQMYTEEINAHRAMVKEVSKNLYSANKALWGYLQKLYPDIDFEKSDARFLDDTFEIELQDEE